MIFFKNYDGVLEVVSEWPGPEQKKNLKDGKGNEYNYYVLRDKNREKIELTFLLCNTK